MKLNFVDAHTHLQFAAYDNDREEVLKRAQAAGVLIVAVGTQKDTSRRAVELARANDGVYAAVGLHPIHTEKSFHDAQELGAGEDAKGFTSRGEEFDYDYYLGLARDPKVVAIGECGLDYYRLSEETKAKQESAFISQIKLARDVRKPLMIHCRSAFPDLIAILKANSSKLKAQAPGIIHFFSGTLEDAKKLLDIGFYFTFGGVVTFARDYDEVIKMLPLDKILSETDAPYVAPAPYRGQRNEPAYVIEVVKKLAEIKDVSVEEMAAQIVKNAEYVLNLNSVP